MSFTRLLNDKGTFIKDTHESTSQLGWILDPTYNEQSSYKTCDEPNKCSRTKLTPSYPFYKTDSVAVDTESDLFGLTRPASRDPAKQYPYTGVQKQHQLVPLPEIGLEFSARQTRLDSQQPNREQGVFPERFFNPIIDLTRLSRIDDNSKIGYNTYLAESDTYKMFIPKPFADSVLPVPKNPGMLPAAPSTFDILRGR